MNHFARLYLDEDVSVILGKILVGRGFDALTARDASMLGRSDEDQLVFATQRERTLVTHNRRHFEELHVKFVDRQLEHSGIIIAARRDVYEISRRIALLLHAMRGDLVRDQLFYL